MTQIYDPDLPRRFKVVAVLIGYPVEALYFLVDGWNIYEQLNRIHVSAETLCFRWHDHALRMFGSNARNQLESWGITTTADFGKLLFAMAEHGLMVISESETEADFDNVFAFEDHFENPILESGVIPRQWTISALLIATTIAAIAAAGFSRRGVDGAIYALLASWFVMLGGGCICIGVFNRTAGWLFLVLFGIVSLSAGLFVLLT